MYATKLLNSVIHLSNFNPLFLAASRKQVYVLALVYIYDFDDVTMSRVLSMSKRNSYMWGGIRTVNIV